MKNYSQKQRAIFYNKAFPNYPPLVESNGWLYGVWMLGNNYRGSGYYGAYPPGYLPRIHSLFPDAEKILQLFSGSLQSNANETRVDINPKTNPTIAGDAHNLTELCVAANVSFDLILADPPYSAEDAEHYGTTMVNRNKVVQECYPVLLAGGYLVWLDQVLPMYTKEEFELVGTIGVVRSTNHRFRIVSIFERL